MVPGAEDMRYWVNVWSFLIFLNAFLYAFTSYMQKYTFGELGAYMAKHVRTVLYTNLLTKHMGWHDLRENSAGLMTVVLSKDTEALEGAATETSALFL